jgi:hypothetical protein
MISSIAGLRAFVVMPFGKKRDIDGNEIDFDRVYEELIAPALTYGGAEAFRADLENRPGNILADMFQELLLADLVVADVTIDNPNAWYELGVRHALRPRGTIMLQGGRSRIPFDIGPERIFQYRLRDGRPDPDSLQANRQTLLAAAQATWSSDPDRKDSPVFSYVPSLEEPEWRRLRVGGVRTYWDRLEDWERKVSAATQRNQPGDVLLLADEPPARPLRLEALRTATRALVGLRRNRLAIKIAEEALALAPKDVVVRQQKAVAHERLGHFIEARQILEQLDRENGEQIRSRRGETRGILGRIAKSEWRTKSRIDGVWRKDAFAQGLLLRAAQAYASAFRAAPTEYFPAINAVTLGRLYRYLTGRDPASIDLDGLAHGLRWAISCTRDRLDNDPEQLYWLLATEAELCVLDGKVDDTRDGYASAAAAAQNWFQLDSSRQQLCLLDELGFQREAVQVGLAVLEDALTQFEKPAVGKADPDRVVLFSGHMFDNPETRGPGKEKPSRFPPSKLDPARAAIEAMLDEFSVSAADVGLCGGACGGDLLFAEACLARGMKLHVFIPEHEAAFLRNSVSFAGQNWVDRFFAVVRQDRGVEYRIQPEALGPAPAGTSIYDRNNRWLAYTAMAHGLDRLRVLCLWDRQAGDGPGGTKDMVDLVGRLAGTASAIIDPAALRLGGAR